MITATDNPRLKHVRMLLRQAKARRKNHQFVLEGVRLIEDSLKASRPDYILYSPEASPAALELITLLQQQEITCLAVDPRRFNELSDTQNPQGILAVCPIPELSIPAPLNLVLVLDAIADPGNMGTILRTAAAAGVQLVISAPHTVDHTNPKVVRSAMSAHFQVPVYSMDWDAIQKLNLPLYIADSNATSTFYDVDWQQPLALVIGGEAHGPGTQARQQATHIINIPMVNGDSLNAGMATAVILYEIFRQRHHT